MSVIVTLIALGWFLVAVGGAFLGVAHTTDNIAVRTNWTKQGSFVAAIGVAIFGISFAIAINVLYVTLEEILSKVG